MRYDLIRKRREDVVEELPENAGPPGTTSIFYASGFGSSAPTRAVLAEGNKQIRQQQQRSEVYAPTEISSRTRSSYRRLPPLPDEARSGQPFYVRNVQQIGPNTPDVTQEWK